MSKPLHLTAEKVKQFEKLAMLNNDEIFILENRIKNMTVTEMAINLHKSEATVHRMIKRIKDRYDFIQLEYPDVFPKRFISKQEKYMDTH